MVLAMPQMEPFLKLAGIIIHTIFLCATVYFSKKIALYIYHGFIARPKRLPQKLKQRGVETSEREQPEGTTYELERPGCNSFELEQPACEFEETVGVPCEFEETGGVPCEFEETGGVTCELGQSGDDTWVN